MNNPDEQALYRLRTGYRKELTSKTYRNSFALLDETSQQPMASCDLNGRAAQSLLLLRDEHQQSWQMRPNRTLLPSRWLVSDPQQRVVMQFEQSILGKLSNPLHKVVFSLLDGDGQLLYQLLDPRNAVGERLFGVGPDDWAISAANGQLLAKLVRLPRQQARTPGILGALRALLSSADQGLLSLGPQHLLAAPVALGMLLLLNELTDSSAGA